MNIPAEAKERGYNTEIIVTPLSLETKLKNMDKPGENCRMAYLTLWSKHDEIEKNFVIGNQYKAFIKMNEWGEMYSEDIYIENKTGGYHILPDVHFRYKI